MARFICLIDHVELTVTTDTLLNYSAVMQWRITRVVEDSELHKCLTQFKNSETEMMALGYQQLELQNCTVNYFPKKPKPLMRVDFSAIGQDALDNICRGRVFIINGIAFISTSAQIVLKLAPGVSYSQRAGTYIWWDLAKPDAIRMWQFQLKDIINFEDLKDAVMTQDDKFIPYIRLYTDVDFDEVSPEDEKLEEFIEYSLARDTVPVEDSSVVVKDSSSKRNDSQLWINDLY